LIEQLFDNHFSLKVAYGALKQFGMNVAVFNLLIMSKFSEVSKMFVRMALFLSLVILGTAHNRGRATQSLTGESSNSSESVAGRQEDQGKRPVDKAIACYRYEARQMSILGVGGAILENIVLASASCSTSIMVSMVSGLVELFPVVSVVPKVFAPTNEYGKTVPTQLLESTSPSSRQTNLPGAGALSVGGIIQGIVDVFDMLILSLSRGLNAEDVFYGFRRAMSGTYAIAEATLGSESVCNYRLRKLGVIFEERMIRVMMSLEKLSPVNENSCKAIEIPASQSGIQPNQ